MNRHTNKPRTEVAAQLSADAMDTIIEVRTWPQTGKVETTAVT